MKHIRVFCILLLLFQPLLGGDVLAQNRTGPYAPPVGQSGTKAMHMDSTAFLAWATDASVRRGPQDTSDLSQGYASAGSPSEATGQADNSGIVSLGDGGSATLKFDVEISNAPGPDFAIFENSLNDEFLELAFVEVSSDGEEFVRFPAHSLTDTSSQVGSFGSLDATDLNNLAGKYRGGYGTPFDLAELSDSSDIDIDSITHIRVLDVIGNIDEPYATYDKEGRAVNDPWPTAFASSGFDLDAVGVVHTSESTSLPEREAFSFDAYYDRTDASIRLQGLEGERTVQLYDISGVRKASWKDTRRDRLQLPDRSMSGVHILRVVQDGRTHTEKLIFR